MNDTNNSISGFHLKELPARGTYVLSDSNIQYFVMRTLFTMKTNDSYYDFEQIICKLPREDNEPYIPYLLIGNMYLPTTSEVMVEGNQYYPFAKVNIKKGVRTYNIDDEVVLPYGHIRKLDMLKISEGTAVQILSITVNNYEISIELPVNPSSVNLFRSDQKIMKDYY